MKSVKELERERLMAMTAAEKVAVMNSLWHQAWALKTAGVKLLHPDWTDEQVKAEVRAIFARECEPDIVLREWRKADDKPRSPP